MIQVGQIICIEGDKRRTGIVVKYDAFSYKYLVRFFDPIFIEAWYFEDMIKMYK